MRADPIPNNLLGEEFILYKPTAGGWSETFIHNVRVEKLSKLSEASSGKIREKSELTVWYDCNNSYPETQFRAGMRVKYDGEIYEIFQARLYKTETPHHWKFTARKIGEENSYAE